MKEVVIAPRALKKIVRIADFLEERWSLKVRNDFANALEKAIKRIAQNPLAFEKSESSGLHRYLVKRRTVILYKVQMDQILIVQVFDARQNYQDKRT